jgi:hypothetical protein
MRDFPLQSRTPSLMLLKPKNMCSSPLPAGLYKIAPAAFRSLTKHSRLFKLHPFLPAACHSHCHYHYYCPERTGRPEYYSSSSRARRSYVFSSSSRRLLRLRLQKAGPKRSSGASALPASTARLRVDTAGRAMWCSGVRGGSSGCENCRRRGVESPLRLR